MPDGENIGHNEDALGELTPERFQHHVAALTRQIAKRDAESALVTKLRAAAKADGCDPKRLKRALDLAQFTRQELEEELNADRWYLKHLGVISAEQVSFDFDNPKKPSKASEEKSALDDARGKGLRAGMVGKDDSENPYEANSPAGQAWLTGWQNGAASFDAELAAQALRDESVNIDDDPMDGDD